MISGGFELVEFYTTRFFNGSIPLIVDFLSILSRLLIAFPLATEFLS
jgi:hypothetical protein